MKNCYLCGSRESTIYRLVNGWQLLLCKNCSLLRTNLSSRNNSLSINRDVYDKTYVSSYLARKRELSRRFRKYLDIVETFKQGGVILDIGCGLGFFVEQANKSRIHWTAYGVELNEYLTREANKELKGQVKVGSLSRIPFPSNYFDCITGFDVLEHSTEVNKNLQNIHKALKDDGIVVIQSPNYRSLMRYISGSFWDWWALPDHVIHFSSETLALALERNGFIVRMIKTYEPLSDFIGNIKQLARKNVFTKALFVICLPALLVNRFIAHKIGCGGLVLVVAQKK